MILGSGSIMDLNEWQKQYLTKVRGGAFEPSAITDVTAFAYFFWDDERINTLFYQIQCAYLSTFAALGKMPATLVVNRATTEMMSFCDQYDIDILVERSLTGGIKRMSLDCIENLHSRFDTEYALIIQTDGFVLRPGLEEFVGKYDYIGAPWPKPSWYTNLVFPYPEYCVGNGGLTLRSKKICEMASHYYKRKYRLMPYSWFMVEDVYYCRVLPRFEKSVRDSIVYAPPEVAGRFAFEVNEEYYKKDGQMPLGFHSSHGFKHLYSDFKDQIDANLGLA